MNKTTVNIEIFGKTYPIKCPEQEVESLKKAAALLDEKMRQARSTAVAPSSDKVAAITALNLAHQMVIMEQERHLTMQNIHQRLQDIQGKVDHALTQNIEMELCPAE